MEQVGEGCGPQAFYWPSGVSIVDGSFWVADTGNRWPQSVTATGGWMFVADAGNHRVLDWDGALEAERRLSYHGGRLAVADPGNNRVVLWDVGP